MFPSYRRLKFCEHSNLICVYLFSFFVTFAQIFIYFAKMLKLLTEALLVLISKIAEGIRTEIPAFPWKMTQIFFFSSLSKFYVSADLRTDIIFVYSD